MFFCRYKYSRKHKTWKDHTPVMAHGLTAEVRSVRQMLEMITTNEGRKTNSLRWNYEK